MNWEKTENKALGYTSWQLIARRMAGDPKPIYYARETQHIEADNLLFTSEFATKFIGIYPWNLHLRPIRILPDDAFTALRERGLIGLAAYRMIHGTEEKFIDATTDGRGA